MLADRILGEKTFIQILGSCLIIHQPVSFEDPLALHTEGLGSSQFTLADVERGSCITGYTQHLFLFMQLSPTHIGFFLPHRCPTLSQVRQALHVGRSLGLEALMLSRCPRYIYTQTESSRMTILPGSRSGIRRSSRSSQSCR